MVQKEEDNVHILRCTKPMWLGNRGCLVRKLIHCGGENAMNYIISRKMVVFRQLDSGSRCKTQTSLVKFGVKESAINLVGELLFLSQSLLYT